MADTLGELLVSLGYDTTKLQSGNVIMTTELQKIQTTANTAGKSIGDSLAGGFKVGLDSLKNFTSQGNLVNNMVSGIKDNIVGLTVAAAAGFGLKSMIDGAVTAGYELTKMATRLSITTNEASLLHKMLTLSNVPAEMFTRSMLRLDSHLESTSKTGKELNAFLNAFGVNLNASDGGLVNMTEQLERLAEGYEKAVRSGQEEDYLMKTLGPRGIMMAEIFKDYADKKEIASRVKSVGMDPAQMREEYLSMKALDMQMSQLGRTLAVALMPIAKEVFPIVMQGLQYLATSFRDNKEAIESFTKSLADTGKSIYNSVAPAFKGLLDIIKDNGPMCTEIIKDLVYAMLFMKVVGVLTAVYEGVIILVGGINLLREAFAFFTVGCTAAELAVGGFTKALFAIPTLIAVTISVAFVGVVAAIDWLTRHLGLSAKQYHVDVSTDMQADAGMSYAGNQEVRDGSYGRDAADLKRDDESKIPQSSNAKTVKGEHIDIPEAGDGGKAAHNAEKHAEQLANKFAGLMATIRDGIAKETESTFQYQHDKINEEIDKIKGELDLLDIDGVDTSSARALLPQLKQVKDDKVDKDRIRTLDQYKEEALKVSKDLETNEYAKVETERLIELNALKQSTDDKLEKVRGDSELELAIKRTDELDKQKIEKTFRDAKSALDIQAYKNGLTLIKVNGELGGKSTPQIDKESLDYMETSKALIQSQIDLYSKDADKIALVIQLKQELVAITNAEAQANRESPNTAISWGQAIKDMANTTLDYSSVMKSAFDGVYSSITDNLTKMVTGAQSFSTSLKNVFSGLVQSITSMFIKMWANKAIMGPLEKYFGSMFSSGGGDLTNSVFTSESTDGILSTFADGGNYQGGVALVGETGPELINFANPGQVYTAAQTSAMLAGGGQGSAMPTPVVTVVNNTGVEAKVTSSSRFDQDLKAYIIDVTMDRAVRDPEYSAAFGGRGSR